MLYSRACPTCIDGARASGFYNIIIISSIYYIVWWASGASVYRLPPPPRHIIIIIIIIVVVVVVSRAWLYYNIIFLIARMGKKTAGPTRTTSTAHSAGAPVRGARTQRHLTANMRAPVAASKIRDFTNPPTHAPCTPTTEVFRQRSRHTHCVSRTTQIKIV